MPHAALSAAVAGVARAVARRADPETDGQLLGRWVQSRDADAFAELVRRLGGMVLGVCRRVVGDAHLADDAFQAAFVVLARRAADVQPREAVRPWLYGVAVRVAREARTMHARTRAREVSVADPANGRPEPAGVPDRSPERNELAAVVDEEVGRLPEHLRAAVVLCELEGVSRKDAAARLGIPEGTLSSRLGKARKLLAERLDARGVTAPAGLALLGSVAVSPKLLAQTSAVATATVPAPAAVAALAHGITRAMFVSKLTHAVAGGLLLTALAGGLVLAAAPRPDQPAPAADPPPPAKAVAVKPAPAKKGPGRILYHKAGHPTLIDPDGKNEKRVAEELGPGRRHAARLSPDGKRVAVIARLAVPNDPVPGTPDENAPGGRLYVVAADGTERVADLGVDECRTLAWSPDGKEVVATAFHIPARPMPAPGQREMRADIVHTRVNVRTGVRSDVPLPDGQLVTDWAADGRLVVTTRLDGGREAPPRVLLMNPDGSEHKALTPDGDGAGLGRLSPDGVRLLAFTITRPAGGRPARQVVVHHVGGETVPVAEIPTGGNAIWYCWSPDGRRIAYTWQAAPGADPKADVEWRLVVCDPDGRNPRGLAKYTAPPQPLDTGGWVDWR